MKNKLTQARSFRFFSVCCLLLFFSIALMAQNLTVKGIVKDQTGEAIIGASVLVKGTTLGTITDFDGNFTLMDVPECSLIEVSFVGYLTQEIKTSSSLLNIILK